MLALRSSTAPSAGVRADVSELKESKGIQVVFPDPADLMNFKVNIAPGDGYYKDGTFVFDAKVPATYPHDPPKITCETQVFHPNIDMEGHVCLNILREDWKPVLTINAIIMGLQFLMLEPNPDDPLNKKVRAQAASEAATTGPREPAAHTHRRWRRRRRRPRIACATRPSIRRGPLRGRGRPPS